MLALKKRFAGLVTAAVFSAIGIAMMAGIAGNISTAEGFYSLPEVDDEVIVVFQQGDIRHPYIIGGLWNGKDEPPE